MILLCKKLGFDVEKLSYLDCQIVESCDEDIEINSLDFVIFTCPALYHKTKHNNCEVLDLRVLKAFKNSEVVAKAILTSELVRAEREVEVVETGEDVVYVGDNLDIISELASNCNLTVITQNKETIKKLYPYEVRVVEGVVIDIKGKMGDFEVMVDGVDLTNGRRVDVVRAGQVIYPDWKKGREGIYTGNEYRGAFKALANLGSFIKLKTIVVNPDVCGVMKSGFPGCSLCFDCPTGSIELNEKLERVEVRFENCVGCGFCASICPLSAIENKLIPSDLIIEKIDAIADRFDGGTLAFVCKNALGELEEFEGLPTILPIVVPCINAVSEVHYLYAVLKGFEVVAIPCDCKNLKLDCFEIAKMTLNAFGFGGLAVTTWNKLEETLKSLREEKKPGKIVDRIEGENKRLQWLNLVERLMIYPLQNPKVETKYFGKIRINDNCTLCNSCKNFCPSNAIRKVENKILFTHALCIACKLCVQACPENAIEFENVLDFEKLQEVVVFEDEMIRCPKCGKPHISKSAYEKMKKLTGMEKSLLFCPQCRPTIILESIYEEVIRDIEEMRRRRLGV